MSHVLPPVLDVEVSTALTGRSDAQDPSRCAGLLSLGHVDKLQPTPGSDVMPAHIFAMHVDDQHARVRDLVLVEGAIVARLAIAEHNREGHASSMAVPQPVV